MAAAVGQLGEGRSLEPFCLLPPLAAAALLQGGGPGVHCSGELCPGALPSEMLLNAQGAGRPGWPLLPLPGMGRFHSQVGKNK